MSTVLSVLLTVVLSMAVLVVVAIVLTKLGGRRDRDSGSRSDRV